MRKTILTLLTGAALYLGACDKEVEDVVPVLPSCDLVEKVRDSYGNITKKVLDHDQDCKPEWIVTFDYDVNGNRERSEVNGYTNGKNDLKIINNYINGEHCEKITLYGSVIKFEND